MKNLLILILLAGVAYYIYRDKFAGGGGIQNVAPTVESKTSTRNFDALCATLQQDMNNVPSTLDGAGPTPAHAYEVKRKVQSHLNEHQEYQVLTQVCDLIIQADAERNSLQQSSRAEQNRTTYHSPLEQTSPQKHAAVPDPAMQQNAIRQRMDGTWNDYRIKTAGEVSRLLGTLKGRTI